MLSGENTHNESVFSFHRAESETPLCPFVLCCSSTHCSQWFSPEGTCSPFTFRGVRTTRGIMTAFFLCLPDWSSMTCSVGWAEITDNFCSSYFHTNIVWTFWFVLNQGVPRTERCLEATVLTKIQKSCLIKKKKLSGSNRAISLAVWKLFGMV